MARLIKNNVGTNILERTDGTSIELSHFDEVGPICWGYFWYRVGNLYGYMNELGNIITKPIYLHAGNFCESRYAPVGNGKGYGYIDRKGQEVCKLIYDEIWDFNNGLGKVRKNDEIFYVDYVGQEHHTVYAASMWKSEPL